MKLRILTIFTSLICLVSCSSMMGYQSHKNTISSSLMDFLYPKSDKSAATDITFKQTITPTLKLPATIGLAFVPTNNPRDNELHPEQQIKLLQSVKQSFIQHDFIDRIEIIHSIYLSGGQGFESLEQVARLHSVDLMALVSYDQVSQSTENNAALLYLSIVGLYMIPGNENSVQTFVDTAIFDVKSRQLLLRAPGLNKITKTTTAVGIESTLNKKSQQGFELAVADMTINLDKELERFKTRVKEEKIANIEIRAGYSGGGSMGLVILFFTTLLLVSRKLKN